MSAELLQERFADSPWKLLVSCVLLNVTTRRQVDRVIGCLFDRWPTPEAMEQADRAEMTGVVQSLGLCNRRVTLLKGLSAAWVRWSSTTPDPFPELDDMKGWPGVGKYARDSYRVFVLKDTSTAEHVQDKELRAWLERNGL